MHLGQTAPYSVYSPTHPALTFQTPASYRWVGPESEDMQAYRKAAENDAQELDKQRKGLMETLPDLAMGAVSNAGTFLFRCTLHSYVSGGVCHGMCGRVVVQS